MVWRKMAWLVAGVVMMSGCDSTGQFKNPFEKEKPFVATVVPADFAVVLDENHETYVTRQHIQQVITAADGISRTTYMSYRDTDNSIRDRFTQQSDISASQIQAMWNEVVKNNLLDRSNVWINWRSDSDLYKRNAYTIQIRANGRTRTYHEINGFSGALRPMMLEVQGVRLPITKEAGTPVVGGATSEPAGGEAPGTMPATAPAGTEGATNPK